MKLMMKELDDEEFQNAFESCGDSDPYGLCIDGMIIGLVSVRYNTRALEILKSLGIEVTE